MFKGDTRPAVDRANSDLRVSAANQAEYAGRSTRITQCDGDQASLCAPSHADDWVQPRSAASYCNAVTNMSPTARESTTARADPMTLVLKK